MAKRKKKAKAGDGTRPGGQQAGTESAIKKDITQLDSSSFRVFSGLVVLFFLAGLLAMNDTTSIWHGAEAWTLWQSVSDQPNSWLTAFLHAAYDDGPISVFYLRFFGIFFFLLTLAGTFFIGKKLFGKNTIWLALLLVGASLLVPNIAKRATADIYLFSAQVLFGMSTLIYLKTPSDPWKFLWWAALWVSFIIEPLGSLLFAIPFLLVLMRSHSQGKILLNWQVWLPALAGVLVLTALQPSPWFDPALSFGWLRSGYLKYLSWQLIAVLPFIGFAIGGIRDLFYKVKRGEEFSLLLTAWILSALLSQSLTLSWVLALLAAKQMQLFFNPKYPFAAWVRGPAILQLVFAFFVIAMGMIYGFWSFRGIGFRSLLAASGLYWGMCFLGVIGLYGFNHRLLIGGPILAGVLLTMLSWFQIGPILESQRHWSPEIVNMAESRQSEDQPESLQLYYRPGLDPFPGMAVYGQDQMRKVELLSTEAALQSAISSPAGILVLEQTTAGQMNIPASADTLSGWNDQLEAVRYQLIVPQ
ncbi:ArnT family glycosyltransferase [Flavilitoribacter nigricans]|uniref:Glycosyltransferase RgtA/B/C/D-like domain-containing protein n=1 Tax=Flavilitoribacter nigricans (strain ATCC 23147 / DSM 23189 / NBRC 102662 / NCIMB 1420 / SS-2) TaxID=1122177 RepID=A0A2D0NF78_FLAN2|nr:hypothetical protein [Flavilitoribacter nigricans]PHN07127.1 hypothetical protein CRP01_07820 [Flavilitoribacter nigricans DSM 23189 = NBRC 102662]